MRKAYFTLATDDYVAGAYCLAKSIKKVSQYNLHILDLEISERNKSLLRSIGCELIPVEGLTSRVAKFQSYRKNPNFANNNYNKIHLWNQEFDKVIYLDADTLVLKNIDHLFDLKENFSACGMFRTEYCAKTKKMLGATWKYDYFNAGVFVITPDKKVHKDLLIIKDTVETPDDPSDQGMLNYYFKNKWGKMSPLYNFSKRAVDIDPKCWDRYKNEVFILHFTLDKPWSDLNEIWWSMYRE